VRDARLEVRLATVVGIAVAVAPAGGASIDAHTFLADAVEVLRRIAPASVPARTAVERILL